MIVTVIVVWLESFVSSHLLVWRYVSGGERVPGLSFGDRVLSLKRPLAQLGLAEGDILEVGLDGRSELAKVGRCDSKQVWLVGWHGVPLDRREITGRAIEIVNRPPE